MHHLLLLAKDGILQLSLDFLLNYSALQVREKKKICMFDFGINCSFKFSHTVQIILTMELHHSEHVLISR